MGRCSFRTTTIAGMLAILLAAPATQAASRSSSSNISDSKSKNQKYIYDDALDKGESFPRSGSSLGAEASDGNSPGYIVGRSYRDDQAHLNPNRMVGYGHRSMIHFVYGAQVVPGENNPESAARWLHYNMFNSKIAPGGVWINGSAGIPLQGTPFVEGGIYPQIDVSDSDHVVVAGMAIDAAAADAAVRQSKIFWDIAPFDSWGVFVGNTLPGETADYALNAKYPQVSVQEFAGQFYTHVVALGDAGTAPGTRQIVYYRHINSVEGPGGVWTSQVIADSVWSDSYSLATPRFGNLVAIAWTQFRDVTRSEDLGSHLWLTKSPDNGSNWTAKVDLVDWYVGEDSWQPWLECNAVYDLDGFVHVVWNASKYSAEKQSANSINPARIYHWTDRIAGPDAGGKTSLITHHEVDLDAMCGRFFFHDLNLGRPVISSCANRLYVIWKQAGDSEIGDSTDCADETMTDYVGGYNAEIMLSVSLSRDGILWDRSRNLTDSKTPGCDGSDGLPCDHDVSASMSRTGYDAAAHAFTYWSSVPEAFEVRDMIDPARSENDFYIDVQYVNDLFPGTARYTDGGIWTNNPIKWFRLPCVDPIIEPEIHIAQEPITHPRYWVKSGEELIVNMEIGNHGNVPLNITNITAFYVQGPGNWFDAWPPNLVIPAGSSETVDLTINAGGVINLGGNPPIALEAYLIIVSDDPNTPRDSVHINTVVADTVEQVVWTTLDYAEPITIANNGNLGNSGIGGVNLDFSDTDCDPDADVYLYDATPLIMTSPADFSAQPYWSAGQAGEHGFHPITGGGKYSTTHPGDHYSSGVFVNHDSTIAIEISAYNSVGLIERMNIFSYDGATHSNVKVGWVADWDIPSDNGVDNQGFIEVGGPEYVGQSGIDDPTEAPPGCWPSEQRFGATGLLGWYYSSDVGAGIPAYNTSYFGSHVLLKDDLYLPNSDHLDSNSLWGWMGVSGLSVNNTVPGDQQTLLNVGTFDILPDDTLSVWVFHYSANATDPNDFFSGFGSVMNAYMEELGHFYTPEPVICGDINDDGNYTLSDMTLLIDHLFGSGAPLPNPQAADLDGCNGVDITDLMLLVDMAFRGRNVCDETYNCAPVMPHDVIRLRVGHRPNVNQGDSLLRLDLYGRYTVPLRAASAGFQWNLPNLSLDHTIATPEAEALFGDGLSLGGQNGTRRLTFYGFNNGAVVAQTPDEYVLWGSYFFNVENWQASDSVVFNISEWDDISKLRFVTTKGDGRDFDGYTPRWDGPAVARDAGTYGDVDGDGSVGINDVAQFIDYLFLDGQLTRPSDVGDANACDGTDVADLRYMINMAYGGAPPVSTSTCDFDVPSDVVGLRFTNWPEAGASQKFRADQPLELELFVKNKETVTEATMTFSWDNTDLSMDSANATDLAITAFPQSIVLFENNQISLTNVGQLFNFKSSAGQGGPGVPGDSTAYRLWATYFFTLTNWQEGEQVQIDTLVFSDGSAFKMVNPAGEGHSPDFQWQPPYACCGTMASGYTGNVDWEQDLVGTQCDTSGRRNLSDITRLIDYVYVTHAILCCPENGNIDGDLDKKVNLSDITRLIDHVYVTKGETEPCQ